MIKNKIKPKRWWFQAIFALLYNPNIQGFFSGKIYSGPLKAICVPGLNCYSCPAAVSSCPLGSLQVILTDVKYSFSLYVAGFLVMVGGLLGRFVCGYMCPFGFLQDLLYKIPIPKIKKPFKTLTYLKYLVLIIFVVILPLAIASTPAFCKYICPAGTITAGLPLVLANEPLRTLTGWLFVLKISIAVVTLISVMVIYRAFCKFLCPLGAIYSLFNKVSLYRHKVDKDLCTKCGTCHKVCKMNVKPNVSPNHTECIRCRDCIVSCPQRAIK